MVRFSSMSLRECTKKIFSESNACLGACAARLEKRPNLTTCVSCARKPHTLSGTSCPTSLWKSFICCFQTRGRSGGIGRVALDGGAGHEQPSVTTLVKNGILRIATDQADYFERMRHLAEKSKDFALAELNGGDDFPVSTFEKKFKSEGATVYRLELRKVSPVM